MAKVKIRVKKIPLTVGAANLLLANTKTLGGIKKTADRKSMRRVTRELEGHEDYNENGKGFSSKLEKLVVIFLTKQDRKAIDKHVLQAFLEKDPSVEVEKYLGELARALGPRYHNDFLDVVEGWKPDAEEELEVVETDEDDEDDEDEGKEVEENDDAESDKGDEN